MNSELAWNGTVCRTAATHALHRHSKELRLEWAMAEVKIYTKDPCPYCVRAIQFFTDRKIAFTEYDLTDKPEEIDRIRNETGWRTVPIIMINGTLIGGYSDLKLLDEDGKLEELLQGTR